MVFVAATNLPNSHLSLALLYREKLLGLFPKVFGPCDRSLPMPTNAPVVRSKPHRGVDQRVRI